MAKRFYNLEKETKALLKKWEVRNGTLPDSAGISRVNDYILRKMGRTEMLGGIDRRAISFKAPLTQRLTVADNPSLSPSTVLSVSCWYRTSVSANTGWIAKGSQSPGNSYYFGPYNGKAYFGIFYDGSGSSNYIFHTATANTANSNWYFAAGTFSNGTMKLYVNGVELTGGNVTISSNGIYTSIYDSTAPLCFGCNTWPGISTFTNFLTGDMSNAFISQKVLSSTEITYLYNSGLGRSYLEILAYQPSLLTSMVSYWPLNESSGTRKDWHGTNHLTAVNNPLNTTGIVEELF